MADPQFRQLLRPCQTGDAHRDRVAGSSGSCSRGVGVFLLAALLAMPLAPARAQVLDATWTGAAGNNRYEDPCNWTPAVVPVNDANTAYNVIFPGGVTVEFDVDGPQVVTDLELGAGSTLNVKPGKSLTILDDARIYGNVTSVSGVLEAGAFDAELRGNQATVSASGGALIHIASATYSSTGLNSSYGNYTLFSAAGTDGAGAPTLVDLSSMTHLNAAFNDGRTDRSTYQNIQATGGGRIDLSGLQTIAGPVHSSDRLRIYMNTQGDIDLASLQRVQSGYADLYVSVPALELPELLSLSGTLLDLNTNCQASLPKVETFASTSVDLEAGTTSLTAPALVGHNSGTVTVREGTTFDTPSLETMNGVTLTVEDGGAFLAPNLATFTGGVFDRRVGQVLDVQPWMNVDNSQLRVYDGEVLSVAGGTYSSTGLNTSYGNYTVFRASGTDGNGTPSRLDLSGITTLNASFNDGRNDRSTYQNIEAREGGRVDLSGLQTVSGPVHSTDRLRFYVNTGGQIDLSSLQRITSGYTDFHISLPAFDLAELRSTSSVLFDLNTNCQASFPRAETFSNTTVDLEAGTTSLSAPSLVSYNGGTVTVREGTTLAVASLELMDNVTLTVEEGGTLLAPNMATFTSGVFDRRAGQVLDTQPWVNVDDSQLRVYDGQTLRVSGGTYSSTNLNARYATYSVFLASGTDGNGTPSLLDLSSITSLDASFYEGWVDATYQNIQATGGGRIDLSGLQTLSGPSHSSDRLRIYADSGGHIDLSSLQRITSGYTDFHISAPAFDLAELRSTTGVLFDLNTNCQASFPKAETLTNTTVDLEAGTTSLSAPSLVSHNGGTVTVREGTTLDVPSLELMHNVTLTVEAGGTLLAPNMATFTRGVFNRRAGQVLDIPAWVNVDDSQLRVYDGQTLRVSAGTYSSTNLNARYATYTMFLASGTDGNGTPSLLDLSSITAIDASFYEGWGDATRQYIEASVDGVVDLSGVESIVGPQHSSDSLILRANTGGLLDLSSLRSLRSAGSGRTRLEVGQQGRLLFGDLARTELADFFLTDATSTLAAGDFHLNSSGSLSVAPLATVRLTGSWLFAGTNEASVSLDASILHMDGNGLQFLEVGGADLDANGSAGGNFGLGQLIVGEEGRPTTVQLVDLLDNGNRTTERREALYLYGLPGEDGLVLTEGSTLILDGLNAYAYLDANWVHLNSEFGEGITEISFGGGLIVVPEPAALALLLVAVPAVVRWRRRT